MKTSSYRGLINKYVPVLLTGIIFFIINTAFKSTGDPFREGKLNFLLPIFALFGAYRIGKILSPTLGFFIVSVICQWFLNGTPLFGLFTVCGSIVFLLVAIEISRFKESTLLFIRVTGFIQVLYACIQLIGIHLWADAIPYFGAHTPYGSIGHPTGFGIFTGTLAAFALFHFSIFEFIALGLVTLATLKTVPILALLGAFFFFLLRTKGKRTLLVSVPIIGGLLLCSYLYPEIKNFSFDGRLFIWGEALRNFSFWGHGPGSWFGLYPTWGINYPRVWDYLHSDWFQALFEFGVINFCLLLASTSIILYRLPISYSVPVVVVLIGALAEFPLHMPTTAFLFCTILSLGMMEKSNGKEMHKKIKKS